MRADVGYRTEGGSEGGAAAPVLIGEISSRWDGEPGGDKRRRGRRMHAPGSRDIRQQDMGATMGQAAANATARLAAANASWQAAGWQAAAAQQGRRRRTEASSAAEMARIYTQARRLGYAGIFGWAYTCDPSHDDGCVSRDHLAAGLRAGAPEGFVPQHALARLPRRARLRGILSCDCDGHDASSDGYTCFQQVGWGKCNQAESVRQNCAAWCGNCGQGMESITHSTPTRECSAQQEPTPPPSPAPSSPPAPPVPSPAPPTPELPSSPPPEDLRGPTLMGEGGQVDDLAPAPSSSASSLEVAAMAAQLGFSAQQQQPQPQPQQPQPQQQQQPPQPTSSSASSAAASAAASRLETEAAMTLTLGSSPSFVVAQLAILFAALTAGIALLLAGASRYRAWRRTSGAHRLIEEPPAVGVVRREARGAGKPSARGRGREPTGRPRPGQPLPSRGRISAARGSGGGGGGGGEASAARPTRGRKGKREHAPLVEEDIELAEMRAAFGRPGGAGAGSAGAIGCAGKAKGRSTRREKP